MRPIWLRNIQESARHQMRWFYRDGGIPIPRLPFESDEIYERESRRLNELMDWEEKNELDSSN